MSAGEQVLPVAAAPAAAPVRQPLLGQVLLASESRFYGSYRWCLDAFPRVGEVIARLGGELARAGEPLAEWQREEVATNVYLLSCALADSVDDHLGGSAYDFGKAEAVLPWVRPATRALQGALSLDRRRRDRRGRGLRQWRASWAAALDVFLRGTLVQPGAGDAAAAGEGLRALLSQPLPADLVRRRVKIPAAFRTQDLSHHDMLALAERLTDEFPDRGRARLVVGLRTAGSYFAPLVAAALRARGYGDVRMVTLRPKKRIAPWERAALAACAASGGQAVVVDEPADTGSSLSRAVDVLRQAGVAPCDVAALVPVHPTRRQWRSGYESLPLEKTRVITLEPEEYHKHALLEPEAVEARLREYFLARGYAAVAVPESAEAARIDRRLGEQSEQKFHSRLKRVHEVRLWHADGRSERRFVLGKSVGWGWLAYHAFAAARALAGFVPPVLGLRDGILYMEWVPAVAEPGAATAREPLIDRAASYVAARARHLRLPAELASEMDRDNQKGAELLACTLSGAYGSKPAAALRRGRLRHNLSARPCPVPALIDAKMRPVEWVRGPGGFLKTDFEAHGLGKTELNLLDPAYDLADATLGFGLSEAEEQRLLERYRAESGDQGVGERLFLYKLLAGTAAIGAALDNLRDPRLQARHGEFNESYLAARHFLTVQAARFCGRALPAAPRAWASPLVVMDIDGVLDKEIFGFPSTTAAGVEALARLHRHRTAIAFNTARTLDEVKEYCRAYGGVGGVAEYGAVAWDAGQDATRVLVTPESRDQLRRVAAALRRIPGVFLNDRYEHSLRAFVYQKDRSAPVPSGIVNGLLQNLGAGRLVVHQTFRDTAVLAGETDKGKGLLALVALSCREGLETIAIGDSEPDLPMFCAASRAYAPRHIGGRAVARLLGCTIAPRSYQLGLLSAVDSIVHGGGRCPECPGAPRADEPELFAGLLRAADGSRLAAIVRALADPMSWRSFVK